MLAAFINQTKMIASAAPASEGAEHADPLAYLVAHKDTTNDAEATLREADELDAARLAAEREELRRFDGGLPDLEDDEEVH